MRLALLGVLLVFSAAQGAYAQDGEEPRYSGLTASDWERQLRDLDADVRAVALKALTHFGPRGFKATVAGLSDEDDNISGGCMALLVGAGPYVAVPPLAQALDSHSYVGELESALG